MHKNEKNKLWLLVIPYSDKVAGLGEGCPRDVEPAGAGEELVGEGVMAQEVDEALKLSGILGTDIGGLTEEVLRVLHTAHQRVDVGIAIAGVDDDGTDCRTSGFEEHQATVGHVDEVLRRRFVTRVFLGVQEFLQSKMQREFDLVHTSILQSFNPSILDAAHRACSRST